VKKYYSIDRHAYPRRKVVGTESRPWAACRGDYREGLPDRESDVEQSIEVRDDLRLCGGDHMWTGIDYLGEARWPGKSNPSGVWIPAAFEKDG